MMSYRSQRAASLRWPRHFGFEIAGLGPSFVTRVDKGSIAFNSGLQPGDQILELDDQDVANMSAKAIRTLAKHSRSQPPTLGVVSRRIEKELVGSKTAGLGFTVSDTRPVTVDLVEGSSSADAAGIRKGDIILEVDGHPVQSSDVIKPYLTTSGRRITVAYVSIGNRVGKRAKLMKTHSLSEESRVKRARNLHDRMYEILGDDYEKKLAAVSVLKQYAEDRDVGRLATALCYILKTPQHRRLLDHIRDFIPIKQQQKFVSFVNRAQTFQSNPATPMHTPSAHKIGDRKTVQVVRENGKFGFVIKGSNPAFVETIDSNGPAEKAGLKKGDFLIRLNGMDVRRCSHPHLINLLQDSGTAPIVEILRSDQNAFPYSTSSMGSTTTISSESSHAESHWVNNSNKPVLDKAGKSYTEKAEYLLTKKERSRIKNALIEYDVTSNIVELFECVSEILDTPSKKTLWMFIIARLQSHHQQYCINQINLPTDILLEASGSMPEDRNTLVSKQNEPEHGKSITRIPVVNTNGNADVHASSFHQQVDYLLTSKERSILKKTLLLYAEDRNVNNLYEDLEAIFDTPSKRTIWMYIVPLLSEQHKLELRDRIKNPHAAFLSPYHRRLQETHVITSSEDDEHELFSKTGERKLRTKPGHGFVSAANTAKGLDATLIRELEETRRAVQEAKALFSKDNQMGSLQERTQYITVIPIDRTHGDTTENPLNSQLSAGPSYSNGIDSNGIDLLTPITQNSFSASKRYKDSSQLSVTFDKGLNVPQLIIGGGRDSEEETSKQYKESKFSKMGGGTFNRHALTALKQLDEAVAAEVHGMEQYTSGTSDNNEEITDINSSVPPPPPPPPPPVAPPPPPPNASSAEYNKGKMNVKRINWEKLDHQKVENTIWEQIGDNADLQDVVRFLELEHYFSTKSPAQKVVERKNEIVILNPRKAYNISILLAHLKLDDREVRHSLYQMDEQILTPELVRQLLAYAPNKDEIEYFNAYNGDLDELSKPDKFTYEMSRVPGYEQRLKALIFKGNFQEKVDEMKEQLQNIRKASIELRQSKKLAKLLELILAIGNYMNEGNERVGQAAGFKIKFLAQLEITKTSDNKATFLHVLAETVFDRFPEVLTVGEELATISDAAKVSNVLLNQELQELRKVLQDISDTLEKFGTQKIVNDKFQDVMGHFIGHASDEIQSLFRLNASTMEEFHNVVQYFGEDAKKITTTDLFGVFAEFITKFEKSHRENMMYRGHIKKETVNGDIAV